MRRLLCPRASQKHFAALVFPLFIPLGAICRSKRAQNGINNISAGRLAAKTLVDRGYKRVGFLGGPRTATSTQDREKGFLTELGNHPNIEFTTSFAEDYSFKAGRDEMLRLLKEGDPAEAYFCGDDVLSIGVLSAIRDMNLKVPEDIGIIGLNDMDMASWANIDLTTIHNPLKDIIRKSIDLVTALVEDETIKPEAHLFECSVVERGTLRPLP